MSPKLIGPPVVRGGRRIGRVADLRFVLDADPRAELKVDGCPVDIQLDRIRFRKAGFRRRRRARQPQ